MNIATLVHWVAGLQLDTWPLLGTSQNHHDRDWSDLQTGQTALPGSGEGRIYSGTKIQNFPGWCDTDS